LTLFNLSKEKRTPSKIFHTHICWLPLLCVFCQSMVSYFCLKFFLYIPQTKKHLIPTTWRISKHQSEIKMIKAAKHSYVIWMTIKNPKEGFLCVPFCFVGLSISYKMHFYIRDLFSFKSYRYYESKLFFPLALFLLLIGALLTKLSHLLWGG
jgi:hypothetical protein